MLFKQHLLALVNRAIAELTEAQSQGRVPKNTMSENHYLTVWITKALKQKSCDISMVALLKQWQQKARTQGAGARLKHDFLAIQYSYQQIDAKPQRLTKLAFEELFNLLPASEWQCHYEERLTKKLNLKKLKSSSIVLITEQLQAAFDKDGILKKNIHVFVRGDQQTFIDLAFSAGFLVFKLSDYKSQVKFHAEYVISVENNFNAIAEFASEINSY